MTTNITVRMGVSHNDAPTDFKEGRLSFNITKKVIYLDWKDGKRYVFGQQPQWINHEDEEEVEEKEDESTEDDLDYNPAPQPNEKGQDNTTQQLDFLTMFDALVKIQEARLRAGNNAYFGPSLYAKGK